jgi:hypothetical protein
MHRDAKAMIAINGMPGKRVPGEWFELDNNE